MKNKINRRFLSFSLILVIFILVAGCSKPAEKEKEAENVNKETNEVEIVDTGILLIKSSPDQAQAYVNGELKGETPVELTNFPIGDYNVVIKKGGYKDFEKKAVVQFGKTGEVFGLLKSLEPEIEEKKSEESGKEEASLNNTAKALKKINLSGFAMYYDFGNAIFTDIRTSGSDLFSRKYDTYIEFVAMSPAQILLIDKAISDVMKDGCGVFSGTGVAQMHSGQTLCLKTMRGKIIALSSAWDTKPAEMEWAALD